MNVPSRIDVGLGMGEVVTIPPLVAPRQGPAVGWATERLLWEWMDSAVTGILPALSA